MKIEVGKLYETKDGRLCHVFGLQEIDGDKYYKTAYIKKSWLIGWNVSSRWFCDEYGRAVMSLVQPWYRTKHNLVREIS